MSTTRRVGRKKLFNNRLTVPISDELLNRVDAVLISDENRLDLIRDALTREVMRRENNTSTALSPTKIDEIENTIDNRIEELLKTMEKMKNQIMAICANRK